MTIAAGIGWYVFPVYMTTIESTLGTNREMIALAVSIWALVGGAFSPVVGGWIDKYGTRRVVLSGTAAQVVCTLRLAHVTALWHLYALFVIAALANTANTSIPVSAMISRRFDHNRGAAMGIAMLGMGLGGLVMPIIANFFMEKYGWRGGYTIFAFFLAALLVPLALWIKPEPKPGLSAEGEACFDTDTPGGPGSAAAKFSYRSLSAAESVRTRTFWYLGGGDFLISLAFTSVIVHMVAFTTAAGISQGAATTAYGTFLAVNSLGIIAFGAAADKIKIRWMMIISYGVASIAMLFLFRLPALLPLYMFAIIFGVTGGGRSALWPLALGESFGVAHLGSILGWLNIPFMIGNAVGPFLAGYIYDVTDSYRHLFLLCIFFSIFAALFISRMRNERERQHQESKLLLSASRK